MLSPETQRSDVEILAIEIDALLGQQVIDVVGQPLPRRRIAQSSAAAPPSSHSGWFFASQEPPVTRSGSNQTINFMPLEWT